MLVAPPGQAASRRQRQELARRADGAAPVRRCAGAPRWSRQASSSAASTATCTCDPCATRWRRSPQPSVQPVMTRLPTPPDDHRAAAEVPRNSGHPREHSTRHQTLTLARPAPRSTSSPTMIKMAVRVGVGSGRQLAMKGTSRCEGCWPPRWMVAPVAECRSFGSLWVNIARSSSSLTRLQPQPLPRRKGDARRPDLHLEQRRFASRKRLWVAVGMPRTVRLGARRIELAVRGAQPSERHRYRASLRSDGRDRFAVGVEVLKPGEDVEIVPICGDPQPKCDRAGQLQ